jgi:hypothetical protein
VWRDAVRRHVQDRRRPAAGRARYARQVEELTPGLDASKAVLAEAFALSGEGEDGRLDEPRLASILSAEWLRLNNLASIATYLRSREGSLS